MNFTSKNFMKIYRTLPQDLIKINPKIMEEIIERSLKHLKQL